MTIDQMPIPEEQKIRIKSVIDACAAQVGRGVGIAPATFLTRGHAMQVIPGMFITERDKEEYAFMVRAIAKLMQADFAIYVSEAWLLSLEEDEADKYLKADISPPPSRDPRRIEALAIMVESTTSRFTITAEIKRDKKKPYLGELSITQVNPGELKGRFDHFLAVQT